MPGWRTFHGRIRETDSRDRFDNWDRHRKGGQVSDRCPTLAELIRATDDDSPAAERDAIQAHVRQCEHCREERRRLDALAATIRLSLDTVEPTAEPTAEAMDD